MPDVDFKPAEEAAGEITPSTLQAAQAWVDQHMPEARVGSTRYPRKLVYPCGVAVTVVQQLWHVHGRDSVSVRMVREQHAQFHQRHGQWCNGDAMGEKVG